MFFAIFFWCIFLQIDQPITQPRNSITHSKPYPSSSSSSSIHSDSEYSSTTSDEYYFRQSLRSAESNFLNDDFFWHVHRSISRKFYAFWPFFLKILCPTHTSISNVFKNKWKKLVFFKRNENYVLANEQEIALIWWYNFW